MPVKDSTIRLKLIGSQDVTSGLEAYTKQMRTEFESLRRSQQAYMESIATGSKATLAQREEAARKAMDAERRITDTLKASEEVRGKSSFEIKRAAIDKAAAYQISVFKDLSEKGRISAEHAAKAEVAILAQAQTEKEKIAEKEAAAIAKAEGRSVRSALSGFGGKMIMGMAAGRAIGAATGNTETGSMAGGIISGMMFGGPVIGGLVAAIEIGGMAMEAWQANAKAAATGTIELTATLLDLTQVWSSLATTLIDRNPFGKAMEGEIKRSASASQKAGQESSGLIMGRESFTDSVGAFLGLGNGWQAKIELLQFQQSLEDSSNMAARRYRNAEYPKQIADTEKLLDAKFQLAQTEKMATGFAKDREQLDQQIDVGKKERLAKYNAETRAADAGIEQAQIRVDALAKEANKKVDPNDIYGNAAKTMAMRDYANAQQVLQDAKKARQNLDKQQSLQEEGARIEDTAKSERLNQAAKETIQQAAAAIDKEAALIVLRRQQDNWRSALRANGEPEAMIEDDIKRLTVAKYTLATEQEITHAKYAAHEISYKQMELERMMAADKGAAATPEGLAAMKTLAAEKENALVNAQKYSLDVTRQQVDAQKQYLNGQITRLEMEQKIALAANPLAKDRKDLADEIARTTKAKHELMLKEKFMSPVDRWRKERDEILEAKNEGIITPERDRHLLQVGVNQLLNQPTGQAVDMASRWTQLQGAVLSPEDDTQRLLLEEFKGLRDDINGLRTQGIPIKG